MVRVLEYEDEEDEGGADVAGEEVEGAQLPAAAGVAPTGGELADDHSG